MFEKILLFVCLSVLVSNLKIRALANDVPCYFIFGDSLADPGNNNILPTLSKANYAPYGVDFPNQRATGRFCNGRTAVDIIGQRLGFQNFIPPFTTAVGIQVLKGVNYASGSSGIRNETGYHLGYRFSLDQQIKNYQITVNQIKAIFGFNAAITNKYLSKCIYSVGMGSNDYGNNYYLPQYYNTSSQYTVAQYAEVLLQQYSEQIKTLYSYGARKVVLPGINPLGCFPSALAISGNNSCIEYVNDAVRLFNSGLKSLVAELNQNFTDAKFMYVNSYGIFEDMRNNPSSYGFTVTTSGCCLVQPSLLLCIPSSTPCPNRAQYLFYDSIHLTEAADNVIASRSYIAQSPTDTFPIDISALAQL